MALRSIELCAGYGGFSLALAGIARTICFVERDSYAAATLVARMAEARLDQAPIWDDLTTFDGHPWRGRVEIVTAGFPCQPFSTAGKRMGLDDDRWLWPDIERIIREVRPRYVFLENVPGVVRAGLPAVLHSLAQLGFDAEWSLYAASDVGAPHRRQRFWLVGHASGSGRSEVTGSTHGDEGPHGSQHAHVTDGAGEDVGDPDCGGQQGPRQLAGGVRGRMGGDVDGPGGSDVADTACVDEREPHHAGCALTRQDTRPDIGGHRFPPRPDDHDGWVEWDGAQPSICRGTDGATEWLADALHLGGNGLVPQCAREAWLQLVGRFA